ncbi:hypothetical protein M5K25_016439 [Dendrobium thyrsiflorum]|uniref:MI domain-containing protein n=1 Tax=Dendrobium thyrsiflorum TaxID=117978 RepID=A0ABD0UKK4_DENTH
MEVLSSSPRSPTGLALLLPEHNNNKGGRPTTGGSLVRHAKEKEMASVLLSALYADVIRASQISDGFIILLESAKDLAVDILDAVEVLALFVARAVVDDIIPPAFLHRAKKVFPENSKGLQVIETAEKSYLSVPHHAELVERKWGGSTHLTVDEVKKKISDLLREYIESGDTAEACRCIRELGVSFFHHEVVKRAVIFAMETPSSQSLIFKLLDEAAEEGLISSSQMIKGFSRLAESLDDLTLDIPSAKAIFQQLIPKAISEGRTGRRRWHLGSETVHIAPSLASARHAGERLLRCWGGGTGWAVEDAKDKITKLLEEFESGGDLGEACQCIHELGMPFFNHEVVKKALVMAMEKKNDRLLDLLQECFGEGLITLNQVSKGFSRVKDSLDDLALDIPNAREKYISYLEHAKTNGWLS